MIDLIFLIPSALLVCLFVWQALAHHREQKQWTDERKQLLDRVMAKDYQEYVTGQVSQIREMKDPEAGKIEIDGDRDYGLPVN